MYLWQVATKRLSNVHNNDNYTPEKSPYTLSLKRSCNKFLYWTLTFVYCILTLAYVIPLFVSAALSRSRTVAICPTGMKRENIGRNVVPKIGFSCVKCDLISRVMFWKWSSRYIIIENRLHLCHYLSARLKLRQIATARRWRSPTPSCRTPRDRRPLRRGGSRNGGQRKIASWVKRTRTSRGDWRYIGPLVSKMLSQTRKILTLPKKIHDWTSLLDFWTLWQNRSWYFYSYDKHLAYRRSKHYIVDYYYLLINIWLNGSKILKELQLKTMVSIKNYKFLISGLVKGITS